MDRQDAYPTVVTNWRMFPGLDNLSVGRPCVIAAVLGVVGLASEASLK